MLLIEFQFISNEVVVEDWLEKVEIDAGSDKKKQDNKEMLATAVDRSSYLKVACEQDR